MADEPPWDDEERWPALLRRIERVASELLVEVERERRIWRSHQPQLVPTACRLVGLMTHQPDTHSL
jgi:hypothetical protein